MYKKVIKKEKVYSYWFDRRQVKLKNRKYKKGKNPSLVEIPFKMKTILRKNPDNMI